MSSSFARDRRSAATGSDGGEGPAGAALGSPTEVVRLLTRLSRNLPGMAYRRRDDTRGTLLFAGPGCRELTGFDAPDLVRGNRVSYSDLIHPDDRPDVDRAVREAVRSGDTYHLRYRIRRVGGDECHVWDQGYVVTDDHGSQVLEGLVTSVGSRGEPMPEADEDEVRFRALVEQSLAGVYLIRGQRFTYVNAHFAEVFGYTVQEVLDLPTMLDLVHADDRALVAENVRRRVEEGAPDLHYEFRGSTKAGGTVDIEVHGRRVDLGGPAILGVLLDVTERTMAERRAREGEKLEAVRRLAAGVAHDLNNVMSTIKVTAEVLRLERAHDDALAGDLSEIVRAVDDGATLSRQLSRFSRGGVTSQPTDDPTEALEGLRGSLRSLLGRRVELDMHVAADLPTVSLSLADLEDVVMNLVLNAQDAMPDGGSLSLKARAQADGSDTGGVGPEYLVLEVSNSGSGKARDLDPTEEGRGPGLGLAIVERIVRDAGGTVAIEAGPERGTVARIVLPRHTPDGRTETS